VIHIIILITFVSVIVASLIGYGLYQYAGLVFVLFAPFLLYKFLFHIQQKTVYVVTSSLIFIGLLFFIQYKIGLSNGAYKNAFIYKDKTEDVFEGSIDEFPEYSFKNNQYVFGVKDTSTRVLIFTHPYQKFTFTETLKITGSLIDVHTQDKKYRGYYKKLNVQYIVFNPETEKIQFTQNQSLLTTIKQRLFKIKDKLRTLVVQRFSSRASSLILGMLLGEKSELSKEEKDMFNQVGLSHILVVSGYNISILISFVFIILKPVSKFVRIFFAINLITLFVLLVGADASVVRAALMGSIIIFSKITKRHSNAINILFLVTILILLNNPYSLFDASLHLSFVATYSLLVLPQYNKIPELILTTIWVFVFVSLYIVYMSGYISFGSIISNALVIFLLPLYMLVSGISLLFITSNLFLGLDIFLLESISRYIFGVAQLVQKIPKIEINMPPSILMVAYCLVCNILIFLKNRYTVSEFIEKHYQRFVPQKPN
jgi:competence protein ComEC